MSELRIAHIEYWGYDAEIEYYFDPGEPDQWYDSNGDPGTPGTAPSVEVKRIWVELESNEGRSVTVDVFSVFDMILEGDIYNLEEKILDYHENQ